MILPALDEEGSVEDVVRDFRQVTSRVVVVDNGSVDRTAELARQSGAEVVSEPRRGYGSACLAGIAYLRAHDPPPFVALGDCDGSTRSEDLPRLLGPLQEGRADLVIGRRVAAEPGALLLHQRFGNAAVMLAYRVLFGLPISDPSPYRALRWDLAQALDLRETTYGFPLEMLVRSRERGAKVIELPVACYRRRTGRSKVAGSVGGTLSASLTMVTLGLRLRVRSGEAP